MPEGKSEVRLDETNQWGKAGIDVNTYDADGKLVEITHAPGVDQKGPTVVEKVTPTDITEAAAQKGVTA